MLKIWPYCKVIPCVSHIADFNCYVTNCKGLNHSLWYFLLLYFLLWTILMSFPINIFLNFSFNHILNWTNEDMLNYNYFLLVFIERQLNSQKYDRIVIFVFWCSEFYMELFIKKFPCNYAIPNYVNMTISIHLNHLCSIISTLVSVS